MVLWDGQEISNHEGNPVARVLIRDRGALLKLIANPEVGFGEMYTAERIDVQGNLAEFLEAVYRAMPRTGRARSGKSCIPFLHVAQQSPECAPQRPAPLRYRQRFLQALA